jgi:hypothetical protein
MMQGKMTDRNLLPARSFFDARFSSSLRIFHLALFIESFRKFVRFRHLSPWMVRRFIEIDHLVQFSYTHIVFAVSRFIECELSTFDH